MDALDREILSILQHNGRATMTEIAAQVGLSLSSCHRRFRDLEANGVIRGFHAELDFDKLGRSFRALVFVTMDSSEHGSMTAFEEAIAAVPEVVQAQRLFGSPDYQLSIATTSMQAYQELYDSVLSQLPGVHRMQSTLVMKSVVAPRAPLGFSA